MPEQSVKSKKGKTVVLQGKWLNVPNMFTLSRVLIAPVIIAIMVTEPRMPFGIPYNIVAGVLFIIAALTDKADGYFARKHSLASKLGATLDPIADKLLMLPLFVALWYVELIPLWVVLVVCGRDLVVSVIRLEGVRKGIAFPASWSGKIKMFLQSLTAAVIIFLPQYADGVPVRALVYLMAAVTLYSGIIYVIRARTEVFGAVERSAAADGED
ncbi:MAG: CDP-diacylglycerol--glycerol-3-phosphate 3-phosphatidyltransferase [Actinobacteria bacterium]|nr:CDP-diacylglycerol--glycerol-3-phosphate 3-phosphatidyltransferase [Actinomycetota bacterium]